MIKAIIDYYSNIFADFYEFLVVFWDIIEPFIFVFTVAAFLVLLIVFCAIAIN